MSSEITKREMLEILQRINVKAEFHHFDETVQAINETCTLLEEDIKKRRYALCDPEGVLFSVMCRIENAR